MLSITDLLPIAQHDPHFRSEERALINFLANRVPLTLVSGSFCPRRASTQARWQYSGRGVETRTRLFFPFNFCPVSIFLCPCSSVWAGGPTAGHPSDLVPTLARNQLLSGHGLVVGTLVLGAQVRRAEGGGDAPALGGVAPDERRHGPAARHGLPGHSQDALRGRVLWA